MRVVVDGKTLDCHPAMAKRMLAQGAKLPNEEPKGSRTTKAKKAAKKAAAKPAAKKAAKE